MPAKKTAAVPPVDDTAAVVTPVAAAPSADDALRSRLMVLGLSGEQVDALYKEGVAAAEDMGDLSADDIKSLTGCGLITAKKVAKDFAAAAPVASAASAAPISFEVLPAVPSDDNWLSALKVGGVLKFSRDTVIGTVSAALASRVGLYELPKKLIDLMEKHAESLEEPVGHEFYELQHSLTERRYSEIFAAIPGATGRYASQGRKSDLLRKINTTLWPALISFQDQLSQWLESWQKGMSNPAMMMNALASLAGGGGGVMPPGLMAPPPTDVLRDAAEGVITSINSIFAGTGTPVAMALAYDAQQIRAALENPSLPAQVGAANREQMLRMLEVAVSSDYPRLEIGVKRFALGVIELPNISPGQTELTYVTALYQLGATIPWDKLGATSTSVGAVRDGRPAGLGRGTL